MSETSDAKIKWTKEQLAGIQTTGHSLLVSAAAGSGKTAVLAARCAHLVCDAKTPCEIDQLLVVTFTEAAAAEMKGRIETALRQRLGRRQDDPRLVKQLALVERAQISTLHGFCARLLRQHFHLLGLDPGFSMLDGDEAKLMRVETARQLFSDRYENDATGDFGRLVRFYAGGDDERLLPQLLRTHELLCSIVDRQAWLKNGRNRIAEAMSGALERSQLGREIVSLMSDKIAALRKRCSAAILALTHAPGLSKYVDYLEELEKNLEDWAGRLESAGINSLSRAVKDYVAPRLPSISGNTPGKDLGKAAIDSVRQDMGKEGELAQMARFSREEWQAGLRSIAPSANIFLDLVEEFGERYRRAKDSARRLDFNDLERFALQILRDKSQTQLKPSPVALGYHRQFHHVLVDEYQDINEVQDAILHLISRECLPHDSPLVPNLFCVGDVKQSIYRFRLAEPQRFLTRYQNFKHFRKAAGERAGEVIDLQANFRSRGPLLDVLNQLFSRLMTREAMDIEYDLSHYLHPSANFPPGDSNSFTGAPIELHLLPEDFQPGSEDDDELDRSEREAQFVVQRIRQLMGSSEQKPMSVIDKTPAGPVSRPIQYRDIVILLRSMKIKADQYADALGAAGIPVHREGGQGYFQSMEIRDMRALLTLLDNPHQDIPMAAVLRSPFANLANPEDCLARIRLAYPSREKLPIADCQLPIENPTDSTVEQSNLKSQISNLKSSPNRQSAIGNRQFLPFHQAVTQYAAEQSDELAAALRDFLRTFDHWRQLARHRPLAELIWEIYHQSGYLAFCEGLANGRQRVANLIDLHRRAAQFGSFSRQGLYRFLKFLESLEAETDFAQPSIQSQAADAVRIMSVHHSKGLEFPVVFIPELGKKINLQDTQGAVLIDKRAGIGLMAIDTEKRIRYPSLASLLVQTSLRQQSLAEELRILYVAATRAKEHLILSGTCSEKKPEQWNARWSNHPGPMPAQELLGVERMLDWVGPAVTMIGGENAFRVTQYNSDQVKQWTTEDQKRPTFSPLQEKLARLHPLNPAPPADALAEQIIQSLATSYPHPHASQQEAARSVTDWTKQGRAAPVGYATATSQTISFEKNLATPKCLLAQDDLSAADIGAATHIVLQNLDFSRPCAAADLADQIQTLVQKRLLTPVQAKRVDQPAIEWFLSTDLAARIRENLSHLRREVDFYLAVPPHELNPAATSTDPQDQIMIRGRIDALLLIPNRFTIIDYKTDRVTPENTAARAAFYTPQTALYRRAMERISNQPVKEIHLVFLTPRQIIPARNPI